jgi:hypothetical protein
MSRRSNDCRIPAPLPAAPIFHVLRCGTAELRFYQMKPASLL